MSALLAALAAAGAVWAQLGSASAAMAAGVAGALTAHLVGVWWFPWARCLRCRGRGKFFRADGRAWRDCSWCEGKGRRFRVGAVLMAQAQERRRER